MSDTPQSQPATAQPGGAAPPRSVVLEKLATGDRRPRVIQDCARLVDSEVGSKRGLTALPLKAGYKVIQGVKPGFVAQCVDYLLDDFCLALEPFYQTWAARPEPRPSLESTLRSQQSQVADALLGVTDRRAKRAQNRVLIGLYGKLRGMAKGHVEEALPGLARTFEPYLKS